MNKKNIFDGIPDNLKNELFEDIFSNENIKIERIVSKGHISPESGWYDQNTAEFVVVVQGEAVLSFLDADDVRLKEGDYINIPAHTKHKVSYTSSNPETIWLAIHF
ncbi:MAG: cupin domain-containing protein [Thiovulaceae bacterium]|nr:cupin domain-containing protein [Sulfurimonadaceae bacterium]